MSDIAKKRRELIMRYKDVDSLVGFEDSCLSPEDLEFREEVRAGTHIKEGPWVIFPTPKEKPYDQFAEYEDEDEDRWFLSPGVTPGLKTICIPTEDYMCMSPEAVARHELGHVKYSPSISTLGEALEDEDINALHELVAIMYSLKIDPDDVDARQDLRQWRVMNHYMGAQDQKTMLKMAKAIIEYYK